MEAALSSIGVLLGSSWASGVNMYLTMAGLGIASRMHWINLPGDMNAIGNPLIIFAAIVMYLVEFVADKIPYFDSVWDSVHTFIRPVGGAALGYMAMANMGPAAQVPVALLTGGIALNSHLAKATTRAAINTSPEPFTNSIASVTEDTAVFGMLTLIVKHPVIAAFVALVLIAFFVLLIVLMFKFLKKVLGFLFGRGKKEAPVQAGEKAKA
ncbi:MAG: DUF4126 domain-containing protein [Candidatus Omnitrophota bacterium]|nr:DUF4126 domain-containing protein [Candidatus Omnitrophota bacterium]